jgi:stage II sporulation protein D
LSAPRRAATRALTGAVIVLCVARAAGADEPLLVYTLRDGRFEAPAGARLDAVPMGSLAKPFVARAWARAHPGVAPPVEHCDGIGCWRPAGHGTVGLAVATAVSCNAYFRALAADTPGELLAETQRAAGFRVPDPLTPDGAIGLATTSGILSATPRDLVAAYVALVREPWGEGDDVRQQLLAGLRDSAHDGTAAGLAGAGLHAKTGTVPALDGHALSTSGWVVAVDASGRAYLGLLPRGTGREAARALAAHLGASARPSSAAAGRATGAGATPRASRPASGTPRPAEPPRADGRVRVLLFAALSPRRVVARNVGAAPVAGARGFVGAGGSFDLRPGDRLGDGDWELSLPAFGLRRLLRGALRADAGPRDTLRLRADVAAPEYVAGVVSAELPREDDELRLPLAAAVLRFLASGPRHGDADVCDLTHCAWFIGRGPRVSWPTPGQAVLFEAPAGAPDTRAFDAEAWARVVRAASEPGPDRWTGHCGGEPLCAARVWGGGDRRVFPCARHGAADRAEWSRRWTRAEVDRAFGTRVVDLSVEDDDGGRWRLAVVAEGGRISLSWDDAHARLAALLGWDSMPSPADRVVRDGEAFRASGRGRGHRVGMCLGTAPGGPLLD